MIGDSVLIRCENRLVEAAIRKRLKDLADANAFAEKYHEFDDCQYLVECRKDDRHILTLSLALSSDEVNKLRFFSNETLEKVEQVYYGIAKIVDPVPGYQLSLRVDVAVLSKLPLDQQATWAKALASLRSIVVGSPLRQHFQHLAAGTSTGAPAQAIAVRPGDSWYVKPEVDSVTCIFPMRFPTPQDISIATTFLQEFSEAKRGAPLADLPVVTYLPAKLPPKELQDLADGQAGAANGGYVSFTFFPHQVAGDRMESVIWQMSSFYALVRYHVQAFKAWMHSRLRSRMDSMLLNLGAPSSPRAHFKKPALRSTSPQEDAPRSPRSNPQSPKIGSPLKSSLR